MKQKFGIGQVKSRETRRERIVVQPRYQALESTPIPDTLVLQALASVLYLGLVLPELRLDSKRLECQVWGCVQKGLFRFSYYNHLKW